MWRNDCQWISMPTGQDATSTLTLCPVPLCAPIGQDLRAPSVWNAAPSFDRISITVHPQLSILFLLLFQASYHSTIKLSTIFLRHMSYISKKFCIFSNFLSFPQSLLSFLCFSKIFFKSFSGFRINLERSSSSDDAKFREFATKILLAMSWQLHSIE